MFRAGFVSNPDSVFWLEELAHACVAKVECRPDQDSEMGRESAYRRTVERCADTKVRRHCAAQVPCKQHRSDNRISRNYIDHHAGEKYRADYPDRAHRITEICARLYDIRAFRNLRYAVEQHKKDGEPAEDSSCPDGTPPDWSALHSSKVYLPSGNSGHRFFELIPLGHDFLLLPASPRQAF